MTPRGRLGAARGTKDRAGPAVPEAETPGAANRRQTLRIPVRDGANMMYLSWDDYERLLDSLLDSLEASGFRPAAVVGIPNGGVLPASQVAHKYDLKISLPDSPAVKGDVILVDDILDTGAMVGDVLERLACKNVLVATVCGRRPAIEMTRLRAGVTGVVCPRILSDEGWVVFPWETRMHGT